MRGKRAPGGLTIDHVGLIPAHAGKTKRAAAIKAARAAHPRACGENSLSEFSAASSYGSSPRMRGKQMIRPNNAVTDGLIPAHAGKTLEGHKPVGDFGAHPRACGENVNWWFISSSIAGSSPRMRGKLGSSLLQYGSIGLIPAHAGKTLHTKALGVEGGLIPAHAGKTNDVAAFRHILWAHPRACGENMLQGPVPYRT